MYQERKHMNGVQQVHAFHESAEQLLVNGDLCLLTYYSLEI